MNTGMSLLSLNPRKPEFLNIQTFSTNDHYEAKKKKKKHKRQNPSVHLTNLYLGGPDPLFRWARLSSPITNKPSRLTLTNRT